EERHGVFWLKNEAGEWIFLKEGSFKRHLAGIGHRKKPDYDRGETISPIDAIVEETELKRRVFYAGPLAGWKAGIYEMEGRRVLVTESPQLVEPVRPPADAPGLPEGSEAFGGCRGWPELGRLFANLLYSPDDELDQRMVVQTYVWHTLRSLYEGIWSPA